MTLIEPQKGIPIAGILIPAELYWVLFSPVPLAGMKFPRAGFPWSVLNSLGFKQVVSLHPGSFDPAPLALVFSEPLEDLVGGGPPRQDLQERDRIGRAVAATLAALRSGQGVIVHCVGGRGRTGTVLGCTLRELGFGSDETVQYLDRVHKARGKAGWPESPWQSSLVHAWKPNSSIG